MNWVGGARSRVKLQGEKKLQKEFFERKRLASKVQRIRPSLSKVKAVVSQDLLFLRTMTPSHNPRKGPSRLVPKPISLEPSKTGRQLAPRPQRDLELPMSPIGKPSTLEIMDTTAVHSERFDRIREGANWSGGRTEDLPRVSTQKIPHRTLLDSFGPPKMRDGSPVMQEPVSRSRAYESCMVPSEADHFLMNSSAMMESLFPPPAKRVKGNRNTQQGLASRADCGRNESGTHMFGLEDALDGTRWPPQLDHGAVCSDRASGRGVVRAVPRPLEQDFPPPPLPLSPPRKKKALHADHLHKIREDYWRDRQPSIFAVAKGESVFQNKRARKQAISAANFGRKVGKLDRVLAADGDAVLELQYAGERDGAATEVSSFTSVAEDFHQEVPNYGRNARQVFEGMEPSRPARYTTGAAADGSRATEAESSSEAQDFPWSIRGPGSISASYFTENPYSKRTLPPLLMEPSASTAGVDFDESIFGPLRHNKCGKGKWSATSRDSRTTVGISAARTMDGNEGIFGSIMCEESRRIGNDKQLITEQLPFPIIASAGRDRNVNSFGLLQGHENIPRESKHQPKQPHLLTVSVDSSASVDCDESVLGPIGRSYHHGGRESRTVITTNQRSVHPKPSANSAGTTDMSQSSTDSVVDPPLDPKKREGKNDCAVAGERRVREGDGARAGQKRKASTFEMMMESLEQSFSSHSGKPQPDDAEPRSERTDPPIDRNKVAKQLGQVGEASEVMFCNDMESSLPESSEVAALPKFEASMDCVGDVPFPLAKKAPGGASVLHELMCLEEEIMFASKEGLLSPDYLLTGEGSSEDPLFNRVLHSGQESKKKVHCSFDSSQELSVEEGNGSDSPVSSGQILAMHHEREKDDLHQIEDGTGSLESQANNIVGKILASVVACAGPDKSTTMLIEEHGQEIAVGSKTCSVGVQTDDAKEIQESGDAAIDMPGGTLAPNLATEGSLGTLEGGCCHQLCSNKHTNAIEDKCSKTTFPDTSVIPSYSNFTPHHAFSSASAAEIIPNTVAHGMPQGRDTILSMERTNEAAEIIPNTVAHGMPQGRDTILSMERTNETAEIIPNTVAHGMPQGRDAILSMERTNENLCQALEWQSWWFSTTSSNTSVHSSSRKMAVQVAMDSFPRAPGSGGAGGLVDRGASGGGGGKRVKPGGTGCRDDGGRDEGDWKGELERLQEQLEMSESTVVWQSLIIKMYQINER